MESRLNGLAISKNTGESNGVLRVIDYEIPETGSIVVENPSIVPNKKVKIGDILIGSNGYVGQITSISFDSQSIVSSVTLSCIGYGTAGREGVGSA